MSDRPNFSFHRNPRFSANQLADYMRASTASQRETVIRSAKFPRTSAVVPYTACRRIISDFLPNHEGGFGRIDSHVPIPAIAGSRSDPFRAPVPDGPGQRFQSNPGSAGVSGDSVTISVG